MEAGITISFTAMEAGITISTCCNVSGDENDASITAMEAGITKVVNYCCVSGDQNDACFTAMEAGITKVITATYPVMLAVLSCSCNEETRTYSEGCTHGQPISRSCDSKTHRSYWPGGSCPAGLWQTSADQTEFVGDKLYDPDLENGVDLQFQLSL